MDYERSMTKKKEIKRIHYMQGQYPVSAGQSPRLNNLVPVVDVDSTYRYYETTFETSVWRCHSLACRATNKKGLVKGLCAKRDQPIGSTSTTGMQYNEYGILTSCANTQTPISSEL